MLKLIDDIRRHKQSLKAGVKLPKKVARELTQAEGAPPDIRQLIHRCAMKALEHVAKHRDVRVIGHLASEMPNERAKDALIDWFCEFGPVLRSDNQLGFSFDRGKEVRLGVAATKPYWRFVPKRTGASFNLYDEIEKLLRRARARIRAKTNLDSIPIDLMRGLESLLRDHDPNPTPRDRGRTTTTP